MATQRSLEFAHARNTDPETSHEAAASVREMTARQDAVLRMFFDGAHLTDVEMLLGYALLHRSNPCEYPRQSESGLRTRRSELVRLGKLRDSGRRALLISGRRSIVWERAA